MLIKSKKYIFKLNKRGLGIHFRTMVSWWTRLSIRRRLRIEVAIFQFLWAYTNWCTLIYIYWIFNLRLLKCIRLLVRNFQKIQGIQAFNIFLFKLADTCVYVYVYTKIRCYPHVLRNMRIQILEFEYWQGKKQYILAAEFIGSLY